MRVLILGAQGRIGKMLQAVWKDQSKIKPLWHGRKIGDVTFDILGDPSALRTAISDADVTLNLAGTTHHTSMDITNANQSLAKTVLENSGDKPVFLISTAAVYGPQSGRLSEEVDLKPASDYGRDKAAMERLADPHQNAFVLRLGNVLGADALLGVDRQTYTLDRFENGLSARRSYIGPHKLGDVFTKIFDRISDLPKIMNIATPDPVSMADLLDAAGKEWASTPAPQTAIAEVSLDTSKLQKLYQFQSSDSTAEALVKDWQSVVNIT